ncbi:hypothetical protein [Pseudostreptobacillus hongkongensis]|uniref:hypothetical protein n=1 Tax=Pseudostreptobacillus hongkongensis TaxID=1162717 RepID=UPI000835D276|nr:hypothetical protein [Pseudostreptobacillus hongkongensis]
MIIVDKILEVLKELVSEDYLVEFSNYDDNKYFKDGLYNKDGIFLVDVKSTSTSSVSVSQHIRDIRRRIGITYISYFDSISEKANIDNVKFVDDVLNRLIQDERIKYSTRSLDYSYDVEHYQENENDLGGSNIINITIDLTERRS